MPTRCFFATALAVVFWISALFPVSAAERPVRAIAFGLDFSGSMFQGMGDDAGGVWRFHIEIQQAGTAKALRSLAEEISSEPTAIAMFSWSSQGAVIVPWTVVRTAADVERVVTAFLMVPLFRGDYTDHANAVGFAVRLFEDPLVQGVEKRVVDISTDEAVEDANTDHLDIERLIATERGIEVNALAVEAEPKALQTISAHAGGPSSASSIVGNLEQYLVTRPNGFVIRASSWSGYTEALIRKLKLELIS